MEKRDDNFYRLLYIHLYYVIFKWCCPLRSHSHRMNVGNIGNAITLRDQDPQASTLCVVFVRDQTQMLL